MSFIPNTTCRRCHRQYPAFRGRCPYCGTKKAREARSAVPETDSAVRGTRASKSAAEAINLQMLIGGVLLMIVMVLAITIVSINVSADARNHDDIDQQVQQFTQNTPIPIPTATPEPTATPAPQIQKLEVRWGQTGIYDYVELGEFSMPADTTIPLAVLWSPATVRATPEWSVDDESIVQITPDTTGLNCNAKMVGENGQSTVLHVKVNEKQADITVYIKG